MIDFNQENLASALDSIALYKEGIKGGYNSMFAKKFV